MTFLLHYITPTQECRRVLRTGEFCRIGQSPWMEIAIDDDSELLDEHFSISYTRQLVVTAIQSETVEIDGSLCTQPTTIQSGMRVKAGQCIFDFSQSPTHLRNPSALQAAESVVILPKQPYVWSKRTTVCEEVGLSSDAIIIVTDCLTPKSAIDRLYSQGFLEDAVRLLAGSLGEGEAVAWCLRALNQFEIGAIADDRGVIASWLNQPNEETRQAISELIRWNESSSPRTWLLAAIAWTGGSLAPQGSATIAPPPSMMRSAIIASLQLACCQTNPEALRTFCIQDGLKHLEQASTE
jgi:hypothetical protein